RPRDARRYSRRSRDGTAGPRVARLATRDRGGRVRNRPARCPAQTRYLRHPQAAHGPGGSWFDVPHEAAVVDSQAMEGRSGAHDGGTFRLAAALSEAAIRDDRTVPVREGRSGVHGMERFRVTRAPSEAAIMDDRTVSPWKPVLVVMAMEPFRFSAALRGQ